MTDVVTPPPTSHRDHDRVAVLFVMPLEERYNPRSGGAIGTVTRELARCLLARGSRVSVASILDQHAAYPVGETIRLRRSTRSGPEVVVVARRVLGRVVPGRFGHLARYRADVHDVVAEHPGAVVVLANDPVLATELAWAEPSRTVVLWLHNMMVGHDAEALRRLPDNVALVSVSHAVADWTAEQVGVPRESITVIHNGVRRDEFHPRAGHLGPSPTLRVVCHGRIDPNKGQVLAARAVAALRQEGLAIELTVVGLPQTFGMRDEVVAAYLADLDSAMAAAGAHSTGRVPADEVSALLREQDVACLLTLVPDPFPLAGLEALASGCAVVAVPLGGVAEMVGEAGVLVEPDVESVRVALRRLAVEPAELARAKAAAVVRSEAFDWERAADRLDALVRARR